MGFEEEFDDDFDLYGTSYTGPSGSKGQSILKSGSAAGSSARRLEALELETELSPLPVRKHVFNPVVASTSSTTTPKMDYYSSYRTHYGPLTDDDHYMTSVSRSRASHLANAALDDNDLISRRSRVNDARVLSNITNAMGSVSAPPLHPVPKPVHRGHLRKHVVHHAASGHPNLHRTNLNTGYINTDYIYPLHSVRGVRVVSAAHATPVIHEPRFERIRPIDLSQAAESLNSLKRHVVNVQAGLGNQKMLLDRYLPIEMGPASTVDQGINRKYYELAVRMPNLEPESYRKRSYLQDECAVKPMTPQAMRAQSVPRHVGSSASPMSDTRKNIRKLISRVRRDPGFYH